MPRRNVTRAGSVPGRFLLISLLMLGMTQAALAANVVPNGTFDATLDPWVNTASVANGSRVLDGSVFGVGANSFSYVTNTGRRQTYTAADVSPLTGTINATDSVFLSFYWYKTATVVDADFNNLSISILLPAGGETVLWSENSVPTAGQVLDGNVVALDVSSLFTETGTYQLKIIGDIRCGRDAAANTQINLDDIVVDVQAGANSAPTVSAGATQVSLSPVNRFGTESTVLSATFSDTDAPGVGAFNATFKIREPNNATELTLVNNQPNGAGGLTIVDNGGGSYTASYTYDPLAGQTLGLYDLHFSVSDGTDSATDDYPANLDELEIIEQVAPSIVAGATAVSISPVNRFGANTTVMSATFTDTDQPGAGAFTVTMKIREPDNATEVILVNAQGNGAGGLTIADGGGGNYTASYTYDPGAAQTLGLYDLFFEVSDGVDIATDGFTANLDELEVNEILANVPPSIVAGATQVSSSPVNRNGVSTTTISTAFVDTDAAGAGDFTVSFKIREPDNATELVLVNAQTNGAGGLTITDGGGGNYTASYTYDPDIAQNLGLYDLFFEVSDGTDNALDDFTANLDELEIIHAVPNNPPALTAGATQVSLSPVNRYQTGTTVLSATFTDADEPGIGAFTVTMKVREPDNTTEVVLVNAQTNGAGGLTIIDGGAGSYTASFSYNPDDAQVVGLYDLYFEVSDGVDTAVDDFTANLDELEINEVLPNFAPVVTAGATAVSPTFVQGTGAFTTTISTIFSDANEPGVGAFTVTFKIREPDNVTEVILVNALTNGLGGLTITDLGAGSYQAAYDYDPSDIQALGFYDLYFEVSDGSLAATDVYTANVDELEITVAANNAPTLVAGATGVNPVSLDRLGTTTTEFSVTFTDLDEPGTSAFFVSFTAVGQYGSPAMTIADALQDGQSGLVITDDGLGVYTATISWDPPDNQTLGYYHLSSLVNDGTDSVLDLEADNQAELLITSGGENTAPIVASDAVFASPAGVERIGANPTTVAATFLDTDVPGIGAFVVSFKVREPDNATEIILASAVAHGSGGVVITDGGGGVYTASIEWDPGDAQILGLYDLYFDVSDGAATDIDDYAANLDELEVYDAVSNQPVTLVAGNTSVQPTSITRMGSDYTMLLAGFTDPDMPGAGAFTVTFKVRDSAAGETTVVSAGQHGQQGLRVLSKGAGFYEASVLWDPAIGQITGTYDLYFQVTDNFSSTATDDYTDNLEELSISASAPTGDGNLLRRNHDANSCGGAASACHNIADHQGQNCLVCHTPHGSSNIYLVRETIQTPGDGPLPVILKTVGIGDLYNDPDPVPGDANSGAMADDSDGVYTGVCEVCHQNTDYHRNDGTQPKWAHHNAEDCRACHGHADGFPRPEGSGESGGGVSCTCHSAIFNPLNSSTSSYHHLMNSSAADYAIASKTCLMCHVDHDVFRDDVNTGIGTRAKNLRRDITTPVVLGSNSVLLDSDYESAGSGGICLSCHVSAQPKGYVQPDGSTTTQIIDKASFDAATATHNYSVPSTFTTDGSTFNANCSKCHNDTMTKTYQDAGNQFSTHDSPYRTLVNPLGAASPADPLEEKVCLACHSTTGNPNAGSNLDYYGVQAMSTAAARVGDALGLSFAHPVASGNGIHTSDETSANLGDGSRHAECVDCHNVHEAAQGTHDGSSSLVSNALKGVWGVQPTGGVWPTPPTPVDNGNVFIAPASFEKVEPAQYEWQICLKCHSGYVTLPTGSPNLAEEINPNYRSNHGIAAPGTNDFCNTTTMNEPWGSSKINYCSDCHRSDNPSDPNGPHGSNLEHLLVETVVSDDAVGTPLCLKCHKTDIYWSSKTAGSRYGKHPGVQGAHAVPKGCFACHMWEFSATPGLGVNSDPAAGRIFVHGMNKRFIYNEQDGSVSPTQEVSDAFIDGYLCDVDFVNKDCWAETCKVHSPQSY